LEFVKIYLRTHLDVTNTSDTVLHTIVTATLPAQVTPGGILTWTPTITVPAGIWEKQIVVTVDIGYAGLLTSVVRVTSDKGASGIITLTVNTVPRAGFTATPTSGIRPMMVVFTDVSTSVVNTWLWNFGDTFTSSQQNPVHTYTNTGAYTVSLKVQGPSGTDTLTRTNYITVSEPPPVADFMAAPTQGMSPLSVVFTDTSTGAVTGWLWDFGDAVTSTQQSPAHVYTAANVYTVSLMVSGLSGGTTRVQSNYITVSEPPYKVFVPLVRK